MGGQDFNDLREKDKDREDLFSATPPIEMMRLILSRQATRRKDGRERITTKESGIWHRCANWMCAWSFWERPMCYPTLYGCRPTAQAWEEHFSDLLKQHEFKWLKSVPDAFVHEGKGMSGVVSAWWRLRVGKD